MAKRKIEAEVEVGVTGLDDVEKLEQAIDDVTKRPAEVEVDADTRDASRAIDKFADEVEDLTDRGKELRIDFREKVLETKIKKLLRDLERLDDPAEIRVKSGELEDAQTDLRELQEFAGRDVEVEIDVDQQSTAGLRTAKDDVRGLSDTAQSGIGPLRGLTDELGESAGAGGVAANAIIDAGEAIEIFGAKAGISGATLAKASGVIAGVGIAIGVAAVAWQRYQSIQAEAEKAIDDTTEALREQLDLAEQVEGKFDEAGNIGEAFADRLLGDESRRDAALDFLNEFGLTIDDLPAALAAIEGPDSGLAYLTDLLVENKGVPREFAAAMLEAADATVEIGGVQQDAALSFLEGGDAIRDVTNAFRELGAEESANRTLVELSTSSDEARDRIDAIRESLDGATDVQVLDAYIRKFGDATDATDDAADAADDYADGLNAVEEAALAAAEAIVEQSDAALEAAGATRSIADANLAVVSSSDDWNATLFASTAALNGTIEGQEKVVAGTAEYNELLNDTTQAAVGAADAIVDQAAATAASNGETLSASAATSAWNQSMVGAAQQASGPLKQSIIDYIATVNGITPEVVTAVLADTQYDTVEEAAAALDGLSETQKAQILAEAQTGDAQREIDQLTSPKTVTIYGDVQIRRGVRWDQSSGQFVPTSGEAPPDNVAATRDGRRAVPAMSPASTGSSDASIYLPVRAVAGGVTNVTVNLPRAAEARDVLRSINRWDRNNGRASTR